MKNVVEIAKYIKVEAGVRYWEDSEINGITDEDGTLTPFRVGDSWCPVINLDAGEVVDWPKGMTASFHFKVCDAGDYYLLDSDKNVIASILNNYVPDGLCHGDRGYGDYIIFDVDENGEILKYRKNLDSSDWTDEDTD